MSLENWVAGATLVGNLALVITLVFVGLQVRLAERNQRALMQQGRADRVGAQALDVAASAELGRVFNTGMFQPEKLTREEFGRYLLIGRAIFVSAEDSFIQNRQGMLDPVAFASHITGVRRMMSMWPGLRALWRVMASQYGEDFRRDMSEIAEAASHQPAPDLFAAWQDFVRTDLKRAEAHIAPAEPASNPEPDFPA
jgi:hypothetical protein